MCFYKNTFNFINAYTTDPKLVVFKNNVMKFSYDIVVLNGGNLVIKKTDGDDILEGDFKYVGNGE
jgi:hypothetical protein